MKNAWVLLVSTTVLALAGVYIASVRLSPIPDKAIGRSDAPPVLGAPRERVVEYEVTGPSGALSTLSFLDASGEAHHVSTTLPWQKTVPFTDLTIPTGVIAQTKASQIGCRIIVDGQVRDEQSSESPDAAVSCKVQVA